MAEFPRTTIGGVSVSRMVIGTNWFLGFTHQSQAKDQFIRDLQTRERLVEILRSRLAFLEERIADMEQCRQRLIDVLREVAAGRSAGYDAISSLPDVRLPAPFRFGRRRKDV